MLFMEHSKIHHNVCHSLPLERCVSLTTSQVAFLTHNFRTAMLLRPGYPLTWLFRTARTTPAPTIPSLASLAARALRAKVCSQVWTCVHLCMFQTPFSQLGQPRCACAVRNCVLSGMGVCSFVHISYPFSPAWPASLRVRCAQKFALRYGRVFVCAHFIPLFSQLGQLQCACAIACLHVSMCSFMCIYCNLLFFGLARTIYMHRI